MRTDGSGSYTIQGLPVGSYLVNIGAEGFEAVQANVTGGERRPTRRVAPGGNAAAATP